MAVELRPHQEKAVDELGNGKILWGGVGTGKTITALAYFYSKVCKGVYGDMGSLRTPKDLYVITTAKKRDELDWEKEAALFGIGKELDGSVPGVTLTVDSWNNIGKYKEVKDAFFVFDEQRLVGSGAWTKSFVEIAKHNEWILLSATPGDTWLDYIPVFVANGFYRNRTEFKREHVVYNTFSKFPKVDRYVNTGRLVRLRNQILVHMPYERHTTRHPVEIRVNYDKELFEKVVKKRWHVYEERPLRDVSELFLVMRKVVNSDASRLSAVRSLMQKHPKLIVFYNFDYELEELRKLKDECWDLALEHPGESFEVKELSPSLLMLEQRELWEKANPSLFPSATSMTTAQDVGFSNQSLEPSNYPSKSLLGDEHSQLKNSERSERSSEKNSSDSSCPEPFAVAEWNGHKHQQIPTTDRWVYLVQYVAGAEGWNCVETNAICFYSQTYSYKNHEQAHGRIDRLNTPYTDLYYYYLLSDSVIDKAVKRSLRSKKNFNESSFKV